MAPSRSSTASAAPASKKQRFTDRKGKAIQEAYSSDSDTSKSSSPPLRRSSRPVYPPAPRTRPQHRLRSLPSDVEVSAEAPISWFINYTKAGMWKDGFANRSLSFCENVDLDFLESMTLPCVNLLKCSNIWNLLHLGTTAFPRLTRLFFVNLTAHREKGILTLHSQIKGRKITLSASSLAIILGLPEEIDTKSHPSKSVCLAHAQKEFFEKSTSSAETSSKPKSKHTHNVLTLEAKLVFTLLARCIMPRKHSRELITDNLLEVLDLILTGHVIDVPNLILSYMLHTVNTPMTAPLPYANLFPKIFEFFEIDTMGEEEISHKGCIDEECWGRLGFEKTLAGEWILKKNQQGAQLSSEQRIQYLEAEVDALRKDLNTARADIVDRQDDTHEKLLMVNEKLNQLIFLTSLSHRATTSIMPLDEDAVQHIQEVCQNVVINCERKILKRCILRPTVLEPSILTVEEYGLVKKYRSEQEKIRAKMMANHTVLKARNRWREKVTSRFRKPEDGVPPPYGQWFDEVVEISDDEK